MKLRAQITIDMLVEDFVEAAEHQQRIRQLTEAIRRDYEQASLDFRQRRDRPQHRPPVAARSAPHFTGRMREYE